MTKSDEHRNIINYYHYWEHDAIIADLDTKRHNFAILCSNLYNDFNIGTVIRCANAFLASRVYIYGKRKFDRRGAVGTYKYEHISYIQSLEEIQDIYTWVGIDNLDGAIPMESYEWPTNTLMCFGQEELGLPPEIIEKCKNLVYIRQYGSVRSLNVGTASGIAMFDLTNKLPK